ncbi:MAG: helicase-exonuclease AddAB subunit AddA [Phycisphaerae bacterium]
MQASKQERTWTEQQRKAIEHVAGDLVVSAAAGSGKTAVLAERCARLVCEQVAGGCGVDELLVLTFTEAAANEMRTRIAAAILKKLRDAEEGGRLAAERRGWLQRQAAMVERASISTLHAFCARVLRQHFHEAQIDPAFELVDEDETRLMREEAIEEVLARWHRLPAEDARAAAFADFFEAYAQGRDSNCRDMLLRVYTMLATTADPVRYLEEARENHTGDGCRRMFERFVQDVAAGQVRLAGIFAQRAAEDASRHAGPDSPMAAELRNVARKLEAGHRRLCEEGAAALQDVCQALSQKWPTLKSMQIDGFDDLKKRTWEKTKDRLKSICSTVLVHTAEEMSQAMAGLRGPLGVLLELVADFEKTYTAAKRAMNRLDFSDLERLTLNLLTAKDSLAAAELRGRYRHVLVDEFQDINPLQEALLAAVRSAESFGGKGNLFVVGDVKQSIYGFRLADPVLFSARIQRARAAEVAEGHVALPHNFRSQAKLLEAMNGLFAKVLTPEVAGVQYGDGHALEPSPAAAPPRGHETLTLFDGAPVEVHLVATKEEAEENGSEEAPRELLSAVELEAQMVAGRIETLMRESRGIVTRDGSVRPLAYRDIAILLRSMKDKAMIFARALSQRGIPVHADLSTGYFDAAEVRDTLALLHVLDNAQQDIPMATVLLGPYGRFSHDDLATIRLTFDRKRVPFAAAVHRYVLPPGEQTDLMRDPPARDESLVRRLTVFLRKLAGWRELLRTRPLHEGLARIYSDARIMPFLAGLDAGDQRIANLGALHQRALKFAGFSKQGLHRFLRFIEKLREQEGDFGEAPVLSEASDVVRIMSVHKSKGLEFPVVIAAGLGGMLNLRSSGPVFVHRRLGIGMHVADVERNVYYPSAASACILNDNERSMRAEELRLLYVALTRARDHLILTGHIDRTRWLESKRAEWRGNGAGPLAEDVLVRGRHFLDWIVPALASSPMRVRWPEQAPAADAQVEISVHEPAPAAAATAVGLEQDKLLRRLMAGEPLPATRDADEPRDLVARVTGTYAHHELANQPAVFTVSELRSLGEEADDVRPRGLLQGLTLAAEESRLRGVATHRVLELLDFSACRSREDLARFLEALTAKKRLTADDAKRADIDGILWVLTTPPLQRVILAAGDAHARIRREIPFAWSAPLPTSSAPSPDPADWPTIRGTIDLLLVHAREQSAEILDYKTDSPFTWQKNLPEYQRQMQYYLRAASDILGFRVARATLLFLAPKQAVEVLNDSPG